MIFSTLDSEAYKQQNIAPFFLTSSSDGLFLEGVCWATKNWAVIGTDGNSYQLIHHATLQESGTETHEGREQGKLINTGGKLTNTSSYVLFIDDLVVLFQNELTHNLKANLHYNYNSGNCRD